MSALWLRYRVWAIGAATVILFAMLIAKVASIRSTATWRERARVSDSTTKAEQKNRARAERAAVAAESLAKSLGLSVRRLTATADTVAEKAREAIADAKRASTQRDAAIARLRASGTPADSILALIGKSAADDSVIAAQARVIGERTAETIGLRQALDTADVIRATLVTALDSARAQLRRDGQVMQSLQAVVRAARPASPPRFAKATVTLGVGYCAPNQLCAGVIVGPSLRVF